MTDWDRITREKAALRKASADRPLEEKLLTLDRLRERSKSLSSGMSRPKDTAFAGEKGSPTSGRTTRFTILGAGPILVASISPTMTTATGALFRDKGDKR